MTNVKARLGALALLDRALATLPDDDLVAAVRSLPDEHGEALAQLAGLPDDADDTTLVEGLRTTATKGRMNGGLEQIAAVLTDSCLKDCIDALGDAADHPSEADLRAVLPGVAEQHGLALTRVMMASAVAGEAEASPTLVLLLKKDETYRLPPAPARVEEPPTRPADDPEQEAKRAARKERRAREQAEARARREQAARARQHG